MAHKMAEDPQRSEKQEDQVACGQYHEILEFLGRKWMGAVLSLLSTRSYRFNELLGAIPGISDRLLTERLRDLEAYHFVIRRVLTTSPVRVEYELSEKGKELSKVVSSLIDSAAHWFARE